MELWLAPNIGSLDALRLFSHPDEWETARDAISTFQTYIQLIEGDGANPDLQNQCGPNTSPAFLDAGVPAQLKAWGKNLAIEAGAVKPNECEARGTTEAAVRAIGKVRDSGGEINYFSIDESIVTARTECHQELQATIDHTAHFISAVGAEGVPAGVIEAYPHSPAQVIGDYVSGLTARGTKPAFLHLDIDKLQFKLKGRVPEQQFKADLAHMREVCRDCDVKFGLIVWGNNADTDANFFEDAIKLLGIFKALAPADVDTLVVQSWQPVQQAGQKPHWRVPSNLPETAEASLTRLLLRTREMWNSSSSHPAGSFARVIDVAKEKLKKREGHQK